MPEVFAPLDAERERLGAAVAASAEDWDAAGAIPVEFLRDLGARGLLCAQRRTANPEIHSQAKRASAACSHST